MELRAFAEHILFARTLDEKLLTPVEITDDAPGTAIAAPKMPGRPESLRFRTSKSAKREFPNLNALEKPEERARLLHFFANHELLATELMALVLLRFPEAPPAFRRGVLQTLRDEQEHTRWYLQRIKECGSEFGVIPVSGYFWRAVSGMENPIDYVAGLSLTFEQANLDFAHYFSSAFERIGDHATAEVLARIHRDEIAHVAYGLKWFRRWKNPAESDWEAFCRHLKFPLSPQRAKGFSLNASARRAAGLDAKFIAELDIYSQSKGRTPNIFWFNPFAEGYISRGRSFCPVKEQAKLARDLANLPQFLCRQDDVVLVPKRPDVTFLSGLKQAGFQLPEFVELNDGRIDRNSTIAQRKLGTLRPWAWSPDALELLTPVFPNVTGEQRTAAQRFNATIARLFSKAWSTELLRDLIESVPSEPWLCTTNEIGTAAGSLSDVLNQVKAIREKEHHKVVVKQSLGLAGGNAIRLWEPQVSAAQQRWIENACERGEVVVERWLDRIIDFSLQLEMTPNRLQVRGYTGLVNDPNGQFRSNWAAPNYAQRLPDGVTRQFVTPRDIIPRLDRLIEEMLRRLEKKLMQADYVGPVGIDAFIYRTNQGDHRLKPIVEVNPRYTMGRVLVELMNGVCPGTFGAFSILNGSQLRARGVHALRDFEVETPVLEGEPRPRLRRGQVLLNDPITAEGYLALLHAGPNLPALGVQIAEKASSNH